MFSLSLLACILSALAILLIIIFRPRGDKDRAALTIKLEAISAATDKLHLIIKEEAKWSREEAAASALAARNELAGSLQGIKADLNATLQLIAASNKEAIDGVNTTLESRLVLLTNKFEDASWRSRETVTANLKEYGTRQESGLQSFARTQTEAADRTVAALEKICAGIEERLTALTESNKLDGHAGRQTLQDAFGNFNKTFKEGVESLNNRQREGFAQLEDKQMQLVATTDKKLENIRETVEEKLHATLNERLGHSFSLVSTQLENVQRGLGEMQTLAQDVGGLKRVLSNVKMRGGFGEVQLHMLLEHVLAPDQYEANVITKKGSAERVEFAVKFPNREGDRSHVWLPIDAKFPKDAYETLQHAYDHADAPAIEAAQKALEGVIKKMAKDICEKYIDVPDTTAFGIMFLPFEGLFAEVVRKASLLEEVQRTCNVIITGPTTLAVILNSLQMGFRTLAIQKRSSEVWQVLGGVKKEFESFGGLLEKAQGNIQKGLNDLDNIVGVRTRAIKRKLKDVEVLSGEDDSVVLEDDNSVAPGFLP